MNFIYLITIYFLTPFGSADDADESDNAETSFSATLQENLNLI